MFNMSRYNLSEILFILDDEEVYEKLDIQIDKEYMHLITGEIEDRDNKNMMKKLIKATDEIREWLRKETKDKYSVEIDPDDNPVDTENGRIHTIEIRENHYY